MKRTVTNMAATVIIYKKSDPSQIFLERKDNTHPIKLVRNQLCTVGGNWIGPNAKNDLNPLETLMREIDEEWVFTRPMRDSKELFLLGMSDKNKEFGPTPINKLEITDEDEEMLSHVKLRVVFTAEPCGDFINTIPRAVLDEADSENKRDGFNVLISYFMVGLSDATWEVLQLLQDKFGNISAESVSVITSLDEIIKNGTNTAFGHDQVLQRFFLSHGLEDAKRLPLVNGIESMPVGMPRANYADYLKEFDVLRKPV